MTATERLLPGGVPKWIRCYDDGGVNVDRYTVVYTHGDGYFGYVGMSADPYHGICQHGEALNGPVDRPRYAHLGKRIEFADLPPECQTFVRADYRSLWNLPPE